MFLVGPGGIQDFVAIQLVQGYVHAVMSLGVAPIYLNMKRGNMLNDGEWHNVKLERLLLVRF